MNSAAFVLSSSVMNVCTAWCVPRYNVRRRLMRVVPRERTSGRSRKASEELELKGVEVCRD
jgi:hypothetical protein